MNQPPIHYRRCPECDASSDAAAPHCWLCGRVLTEQDELLVAELVGGGDAQYEPLFRVLTLAAGGLALLLIAGAAPSEPGIAMYVAICTGPAFLATAVRVVGRRALGKPFTWQSTFLTFVMSVTVVLAIFGLLLIAAVVMLFVICLRSL